MKILFRLLPVLWTLALPLGAAEVKVFAAASLTDALQQIAARYAAVSGDKISFDFAGSNVLARQIAQGAPADLFLSADEAQMDAVAQRGLVISTTRRDLLSNTLVFVVPSDSALTTLAAADLARPKIKHLALADPRTVPAGVYARAYLEKVGVWPKVQAKVVPTENVRAALAAVESGNAEAGMVYKTDALAAKKAKIAGEVAAADGPKIVYPIALIKNSAGADQAAAAQNFLAYLESAPARAIFAQAGFLTPGK